MLNIDFYNKKKGFTVVELLMTFLLFSILSIIIYTFLASIIKISVTINNNINFDSEYNTFISLLENDLNSSDKIQIINSNELFMESTKKTVEYSYINNKMRRRAGEFGKYGNNYFFENIESFIFDIKNYSNDKSLLKIHIVDKNKKEYVKVFCIEGSN